MTPEIAQKILREDGLQVSVEMAKEILDFLNNLAETSLVSFIKQNESLTCLNCQSD